MTHVLLPGEVFDVRRRAVVDGRSVGDAMTGVGRVSAATFDWTVDRLEELCAISSASGDLDGLGRMASTLAGWLKPHGFSSEVCRRAWC